MSALALQGARVSQADGPRDDSETFVRDDVDAVRNTTKGRAG